ncbi:hypothetical protein CN643_16430, partial [Parageobacillus yumthangensis]
AVKLLWKPPLQIFARKLSGGSSPLRGCAIFMNKKLCVLIPFSLTRHSKARGLLCICDGKKNGAV